MNLYWVGTKIRRYIIKSYENTAITEMVFQPHGLVSINPYRYRFGVSKYNQ